MTKKFNGFRLRRTGLPVALLCCFAYETAAFAGDKEYPLQGKVVALGTAQEVTAGGGTVVAIGDGASGVSGSVENGTRDGETAVSTKLHRTYTVKSSTRVYVLECPNLVNTFHILGSNECGGKNKIAISDVIHFRIWKNDAYIQTANGKEQRLSVLSESTNEVPRKEESNP